MVSIPIQIYHLKRFPSCHFFPNLLYCHLELTLFKLRYSTDTIKNVRWSNIKMWTSMSSTHAYVYSSTWSPSRSRWLSSFSHVPSQSSTSAPVRTFGHFQNGILCDKITDHLSVYLSVSICTSVCYSLCLCACFVSVSTYMFINIHIDSRTYIYIFIHAHIHIHIHIFLLPLRVHLIFFLPPCFWCHNSDLR